MSKRPSERSRDVERKRKARRSERDLKIPRVRSWPRRKRAEKNILDWLKTYFPETFTGEFTSQRCEMVHAILAAARFGGDQAIAAPRGEGKTTIAECVGLYALMTGLCRFLLIAAATGPDAARILGNIKQNLERNELLAADYPEICFPIVSLEGAPQRAGSQTVNGKRTYLKWGQDHIVLPTVPKSRGSGAVITTRGMDAAIRGIRVGTLRPDLVVIDDPETRESVRSDEQTTAREMIIEADLAGLKASGKRLSRVMLTTLMRRVSLSAKYTDKQQKPSWKGKRFRLIDQWPERQDLWEEYISLRQADFQAGDEHARRAHAFYIEHRDEMDRGAVVANQQSYVPDLLLDGTQQELSTLQAAYNIVADRGQEHFDTEYQNDPPEEAGPVESGITAHRVQCQVGGYPRRVVPPGCTVVTQGVDCGKFVLHWVVKAWLPDGTGYVIDYGVQEVYGTAKGSDVGLDKAIARALHMRRQAILENPYIDQEENPVAIAKSLVDARYRKNAVYHFVKSVGAEWQPSMGYGQSHGCVQMHFHSPAKQQKDRILGDNWFQSWQPAGVWLVACHTDHWKRWEHDRWMTPPVDTQTGKVNPGTCLLFGEPGSRDGRLSADQKSHFSYAKHITNEVEQETPVKGRGMVRRWVAKSDTVHWFDASYLADIAASMKGVRLFQPTQRPTKPKRRGGKIFAMEA